MTYYGITARSRAYVQRRAELNMKYECRIERVLRSTFDMETGTATSGGRSVVYEGPCRIWESRGQTPIQINEEDVIMQSTTISIPWDVQVVPKRDDEISITDSDTDQSYIGMRFVIMDSVKGGDLRPTRSFLVMNTQESGSHG